MRAKKLIDDAGGKIVIAHTVKTIHPVVASIAINLAGLEAIRIVKISPGRVDASSAIKYGRIRFPVTTIDHPIAISISLIIDCEYKEIQFYTINSPVKGYGTKLVNAVITGLPHDWGSFVAMDFSGGFWEKMIKKHSRLEIL